MDLLLALSLLSVTTTLTNCRSVSLCMLKWVDNMDNTRALEHSICNGLNGSCWLALHVLRDMLGDISGNSEEYIGTV